MIGGLRVAGGEEGEPLGALHDHQPVARPRWPKRSSSRSRLGALAAEQRDLLGVLPRPHQVEAKVGLEALLAEIERRPAATPTRWVSVVPIMA